MGKSFHFLPIIGLLVHPIKTLAEGWSAGYTPQKYGTKLLEGYIGYDLETQTPNYQAAAINYGAIIGCTILSKILSKFGINKMLPKGFNF